MSTPAEDLTGVASALLRASARVREVSAAGARLDQASAYSDLLGVVRQASADLERLGDLFERRADEARRAHALGGSEGGNAARDVREPLAPLRFPMPAPGGDPPRQYLEFTVYKGEGSVEVAIEHRNKFGDDAFLNRDEVRRVRDWFDDWLALYSQRHICSIEAKKRASGGGTPAVENCTEDNEGRFWAQNDEYASQVAYCPFCGMQAPKPPA